MTTLTIDEQLIADLFDIQPDSVVWFTPIIQNNQVIDFQVRYANEAAAAILRTSKAAIPGALLQSTDLMDADSRKLIFEQCLQVWQNGEPIEYTYFSPGFEKYFRVQRSKVMGGILSITRDRTEDVKKERQIEEQARLLHGVIESSPNGIALYQSLRDRKGEIVDFRMQLANQRSAELTGFTLEELYKNSVKELMAIRGHSKYFEECKEVVETGKSKYYEYYSVARHQWIAFSIVKYGDGYLLNYMDITATKQQTDHLNGILDASINGIMSLEGLRNEQGEIIDLKILQINKAFTKILGLSEEEVVDKKYLSIFPKTKDAGIFDLHVEVLKSGQTAEKEFYYDGEGYDGWYRVVISKMGENGIVQTFTETTEAVRDKLKIQESARFLQEVINGSHTGILVLTPVYNDGQKVIDYRFKTANEQLAGLVKRSPEELIGELHSKWFPEYYGNGAFEQYNKILEADQPLHFESHFENEQHDRWMDVSGKKIGNDILISFHEFTALKKLQLELEATIRELKNSNERLSQFTHVASHDLKEPLRKIIMYSNLMEDRFGKSLEEGSVAFLQKIQQTSYRMQALISDLLCYAQVNTKPEAAKEISLATLLQNVVTDLEAVIEEKNAIVTMDALPTVKGDPAQLHQLFQNLVSNALKFHKKDVVPNVHVGAAYVHYKNLPPAISAIAKPGYYYCIQVKDNGIGFSSEQTAKMFELFQRLHGSGEYEGTGIGLAIVSKVVENHAGFILAESEPGKGSAFTVYLPASNPQ